MRNAHFLACISIVPLVSSLAHGAIVLPGGIVALAPASLPGGTTLASQPITGDVLFTSNAPPPFLLFKATLKAAVLQTPDSALAFLYKLESDAQPMSPVREGLESWAISGFAGYNVDVAYAAGEGLIFPTTVSRSADGDILQFSGYPVEFLVSGAPASTLILQTSASQHGIAANTTINFRDILREDTTQPVLPGRISFTTFGPLPVPEPSSLIVLVIGGLLGSSRQLRSMK